MTDVIMESVSRKQLLTIQNSIMESFDLLSEDERNQACNKVLNIEQVRVMLLHQHDGLLRLYMHISTVEALRAVRQLFDSGQLKSIVESFFNLLLTDTHCEPVRVKLLSLVNYCRCEQYFNRGELVSNCCL